MGTVVAGLDVTSDVIPVTLQGGALEFTIKVVSGGTLTVADNQELANSTTVALNATGTYTQKVWVKSASRSSIVVTWLGGASATVGTDGTIGGPSGTPLSSSVVNTGYQYTKATYGNYPVDSADNMAIGSVFANIIPGDSGDAHANVAYGSGQHGALLPGNLNQITTGYDNTAIGAGVMCSETTGHSNTAMGADALSNAAGSNSNTAIGAQSLEATTTGTFSTACGQAALTSATTPGKNDAFGAAALTACTTGTENVALGQGSLAAITTTSNNTAVGYYAAYQNTGTGNTAVGNLALSGAGAGGDHVAVGNQAGVNITTATSCTIIGNSAGNTDGTTATTNQNRMTLIGELAQSQIGNVIVLGKGIATRPNLIFGVAPTSDPTGGGVGVFFIANAATNPASTPSGGGTLYVTAGALTYKGSSGTVTTLGNA